MSLCIESVTVHGFRGIPGTETFTLDKQNTVVVGPNGTGKSTLTQALEFLLTGKVSALSGTGTGRINAKKHIPNHRADPADVYVEALFVDENGEPLRARREFTSRSSLDADRRSGEFDQLLTLANQGLCLLTREELLSLVVTTPGTRKDQLQQLLDLSGVDERRRQLKRLARKASTEAEHHDQEIKRSKDVLQESLSITRVAEETILEAVNDLRAELDGGKIEFLKDSGSFREGVSSPAEQATHPLQRSSVRKNISWLHNWLSNDAPEFDKKRHDLAETLSALQSDKEALQRVSQLELVRQGQDLVDDETETCPLCLEEWQPGEVKQRLEARRRRLSRVEERTEQLQHVSTQIRREADNVATKLDRLREALDEGSIETSLQPLVILHGHMTNVLETLDQRLFDDITSVSPNDLNHAIDTADPLNIIKSLQAEAESLPGKSELQDVWDSLYEAEHAYDDMTEARQRKREYTRVAGEVDTAHKQFLRSRDEVLGEVYESIADRFADFYTRINPDEDGMDPALNPTETGVEFSVGFFAEGEHPPHALHSEGHQDSMGVCLFLALADHFSPLEYTPVMLDDVVMSVDQEHRQRVAEVLADELSQDFQFIITTHDERWAKQLVDSGAVSEENVHAFEDWSPDYGPVRTSFDI